MFYNNRTDWPTEMDGHIKRIECITSLMWKAELLYTRVLELQDPDIYEKLKFIYKDYEVALCSMAQNAQAYEEEATSLLNIHHMKKK